MLLLLFFCFFPSLGKAATFKYVQLSSNTSTSIQAGTTGYWIWIDSGTIQKLRVTSQLSVPSLTKFYVDGGSDTYIVEGAANRIQMVAGGTTHFTLDHSGFLSIPQLDVYIDPTKKFYLDGGGDTYITESSGNVMDFYTGGTLRQRVSSAGEITRPTNPSFLATSTGAVNCTGDGTVYTMQWRNASSEVYAQDNNPSGSTFTAPVTGRYFLSATVTMQDLVAAHTGRALKIVTTVGQYNNLENDTATASSADTRTVTVVADMTAGDTATV